MREITPLDYDQDIISQGEQFQIDTYYEPKDPVLLKRIEIVLAAVNPQEEETILDAGCGVGTFAFHTAKKGAITYGIDYSQESIRMAQKISEKYNLEQNPQYLVGSVTNLPFKSEYFDKVIAADIIEHLADEDKEKMLSEVWRVLKRNGRLVIFTPNSIRENIGGIYWNFRHILLKDNIPKNDLHFGLISKYRFEPMLKKCDFRYTLLYEDITRPYLAKIPGLRIILALNLLWIAKKA